MVELSKAEQKKADMAQAAKLGKTYKEVRKDRRSTKRSKEPDRLQDSEHGKEVKRMRAYSKDYDVDGSVVGTAAATKAVEEDGQPSKRRRTRSVDIKEEKEAVVAASKALTVAEWLAEHSITIRGHGKESSTTKFPDPYREFGETPFESRILESFHKAGFTMPTAIQGQAWPIALQGKDMICVAKTGSGKTCGFLLPAFHQFLQSHPSQPGTSSSKGYTAKPPMNGSSSSSGKPKLLVLAPTRELSVQIMEQAVIFGRLIGIRSLCCYGGSSKYPQIAALQRGVECIIATPGRLNDLIEMRKVDLSAIQFLVLDEVRTRTYVFLVTRYPFACLTVTAIDTESVASGRETNIGIIHSLKMIHFFLFVSIILPFFSSFIHTGGSHAGYGL